MNRSKQAVTHFETGKNCAQSVLLSYAAELGLSQDQAFSLTAGLGGGIARNGSVCGAVSGAVLVLGLIYGQPGDDPDGAKEKTAAKVNQFIEEFTKSQGSINCKDLIDGIDLKTPEGRQEWADRQFHESACVPAIQTAVSLIETIK